MPELAGQLAKRHGPAAILLLILWYEVHQLRTDIIVLCLEATTTTQTASSQHSGTR